jgi:hypothetical protein
MIFPSVGLMVGLVSSVSGLVGLPVVRVPEVVENVDQYVDHSVENSGSVVGMVVGLVGVMSGLVDKPDVVDLESIVRNEHILFKQKISIK